MPAPAIDGTAKGTAVNASSGIMLLSTSATDDIIVVGVILVPTTGSVAPKVSQIRGAGLFWRRRVAATDDLVAGMGPATTEIWYARAPAILTNALIIVIFDQAVDAAFIGFGISGTNPFLAASAIMEGAYRSAVDATGSATTPGAILTAPDDDSLVLGFRFTTSVPSGVTPGSGFTDVLSNDDLADVHAYVEEQQFSTAPGVITVDEGQSLAYWRFYAIAVIPSPEPAARPAYLAPAIAPSKEVVVAVEIDLYDRDSLATVTLRLSSGTLFDGDDQFVPVLHLPILLGSRISGDNYGQVQRGTPNGGEISFAIHGDEVVGVALLSARLDQLRYHWVGRPFRVYSGVSPTGLKSDLDLVYTGAVADLVHDTLKASVKTTDTANTLNRNLFITAYDDSFPVAIQGKFPPNLWGKLSSIEPLLEDEPTQLYRVSNPSAQLDDILAVRVGGVAWERTASDPPGAGQWVPDLPQGTFKLGSSTDGGEVRVDAQAVGFDTLYTGDLLTDIVTRAGGTVDAGAPRFFSTNNDDLVGYHTGSDAVNVLDLLDDITQRQGGWWSMTPAGEWCTVFGCRFVDLPGAAERTLQRVVTQLEMKRLAVGSRG